MNVCPGEGVAYDSYYNETDRVNINVAIIRYASTKVKNTFSLK